MLAETELEPLGDDERNADVVVIGAGIIGIASALELRLAGRDVLLIDGRGVASGASRGNAGALAYSDILPLASPGIVRRAPRWLFDPLGPLAIRPSYLPRVAPWLWRFWRASEPSRVQASTRALIDLMTMSSTAMSRLLQTAGASHVLRDGGNLHFYDDEGSWRRSLDGWEIRSRAGIDFQHLEGAEAIAALQPGVTPSLRFATFVPHWQTVVDPLQLCLLLAEKTRALGGRLRRAQIGSIRCESDNVCLRLDGGNVVKARQAVVCAGAWSHRLAATLGDVVPLEAERGYNTTLPAGAFDLRRQLTFTDHGFVVTPIGGGIRVGGAVEFAGLEAAPRFARADALLAKACHFLPGLRSEGGTQWMGFRPSLPDSLPVIGPSTRDGRVIYAFGHGHSGLTQSAATATLVRQLVLGQATDIDLAPFSVRRFANPTVFGGADSVIPPA